MVFFFQAPYRSFSHGWGWNPDSGLLEFYGMGLDSPFTHTRVYWLTGDLGERLHIDPVGRRAGRHPCPGAAQ